MMGVPEEKWEKESAYIRNNGLKKKTQQLLKSEGRNEYTDTGSSMNFKCDKSKETQTEINYNQTAKSQRQRASWTARKGITKST